MITLMSPICSLVPGLPLAQREAWESLGNRFSGKHAEFDTADLMAMAGVAVAAGVFIFLLRWLHQLQQARRMSNQPHHLFADLCAAHRLGRRDRKRLRLLAEAHDLPLIAMVFVRPDLFSANRVPRELKADEAEFAQLKIKLFGDLKAPVPKTAIQRSSATTATTATPTVIPPVVAPTVDVPLSNV